jgi:hypothetical protein
VGETGLFSSPQGLVFATRQVMDEGWPVLYVEHAAGDGSWQFVNGVAGDTEDEANVVLVHAEHVLELDPTLRRLADLPPGWCAWRPPGSDDWTRGPRPDDPS